HMNRKVNEGQKFNLQEDMLPLLSARELEPDTVRKLIAEESQIRPEHILGMDLFLYNRMKPSIWRLEEEFLSCPMLDDSQCAYASLKGFRKGKIREASMSLRALTTRKWDPGPNRVLHPRS